MATFLFNEIVFGPVKSRRLGVSLGINLLPLETKFCNFDCIYCECGRTLKKGEKIKFHSAEEVNKKLNEKLAEMKSDNYTPDVITFAGNGEPTIHPEFPKIIENTIEARNKYFPNAKIAVLSNATVIHQKEIFETLSKIEHNILKLDSAFDETIKILNNPPKGFTVEKLVKNLKAFKGKFHLQTMFLKGIYNGQGIDNTTDKEVGAWLETVKELKPELVMIYTIARDTPVDTLEKATPEKLDEIAIKIEKLGFKVQISY